MNVKFLLVDKYGTQPLLEKETDFVPRIGERFSIESSNRYLVLKVVDVNYDIKQDKIYVIGEGWK